MPAWESYNLPDFRIGKSRSQPSPYSTTEPFSGPLYIENISDDIPVSWDVQIVCDGAQRSEFQTFLSDINYSGEFDKILRTEVGLVSHSLRIISGIPQPKEISNNVWAYSFTVYATELNLNPPLVNRDIRAGEAAAISGEPDALSGE